MGSEDNGVIPEVDESTAAAASDNRASNAANLNGLASGLKVDRESYELNILREAMRGLHHSPGIYRQDVVRHKKTGAIGIVNEVAGDADSDSSMTDDEEDDDDEEEEEEDGDDDDDDEEGDRNEADEDEEEEGDDSKGEGEGNTRSKYGGGRSKNEALQADQVRVSWSNRDTEPIQHMNDVIVVDRGFLHGDYIASALDPTGQVGVVQGVNISVDLLRPDGFIIKDVSSRDLKRVREFAVGDYVVLGPWLGRVDDVLDNVTVLVDDGSLCKVIGAEPQRLKPIFKSAFTEDDHFPYYPGQRVKATSSSVFKNSRWLSGLWKANRLEGTVTKVTTGSVFIYWIASAGYGPDSSTSPAEEQSPKNLKLLSCFAHANWQVGDCCLLPASASQSTSTTLDKGLPKHKLNSMEGELDSSLMENECDSEDIALEELDENNVTMEDGDPAAVPDGDTGNIGTHASPESSSCSSLKSISKEPARETWPLHRKKIRKVVFRKDKKARKKEENFERALLIINTRTKVDVAWQDGTIGRGLDSTKLIPIESPGDHEFVAEEYVVEKASDDVDNDSEPKRVGVVKSVNAKEKTANVRWLKPVVRPEDPREFDMEEIVSVYELEGHPDYDYSYGDVVVRLSPVSVSAQPTSYEESPAEFNQETKPNEAVSKYKCMGSKKGDNSLNDESCGDFLDLSWVGNITGLRNGDIEVTWADGMVSTVGPQAIFVVGRDDDDDSITVGSEVSDDAVSWETVDDNEMDVLENAKEDTGLQRAASMHSEVDENDDDANSGRSPLSLPLAALDFVTRLATGLFSRGRKNTDSFSDSAGENSFQYRGMTYMSEERDCSDECSSQKSNVIDNDGAQEKEHTAMEALVSLSAAETSCKVRADSSDNVPCLSNNTSNFKRFDIAKDPLDHYFLGSNGQINNGRKWLKKVQQDWNILQNNLPDGIYVRVYEDRMDLLRAVIVGAYGTPYQDGLFFFDFHLPPEYPDVPPSAYYHSGGWRINPNLYEEGKVCLSLLNTWTGRGNEVWDSKSSSILQVLVSLQGLVLNSKPYFNEAGYDKQIGTAEGEKNSLAYNENTFLLNCKTMMYLMRKTPKDFEDLVKEHFRKRGYYILKACDAYMKGSLIGSLSKDASVTNVDTSNLTSVGFKLMLAKVVPRLYSALDEVGADCHGFKHLLQS